MMNYNDRPSKIIKTNQFNRTKFIKSLLILSGVIIVARLFYIQIVHHDYYQNQALAEHLKKFEIPATRGIISMEDGNSTIPVVLNQPMYTIYADPTYVTNAAATAQKITGLLGVNYQTLVTDLKTPNTEYVVLANHVNKTQADKVTALNLNGIGEQEISARNYPDGDLAAQVLGFVNANGEGQYGIEGYLNNELAGKPGLEKAVTDEQGIPLAINGSNTLTPAINGKNITLTLDIGLQTMVEQLLQQGIKSTESDSGTAIIMDANTGAVKAMASYPTYNPSQYASVTNPSLFINPAVSTPWEPGSVMKPLLFGAAFTQGTATPQTSFFDPNYVIVDGNRINNAEYWPPQTVNLQTVIDRSLNTGAVFVLKTLGGGQINEQARTTWYDYLANHYFFGKQTGIQQTDEQKGILYGPNFGYDPNFRYANMAFGQGVSVTPIQLVAAYASIMNGGTYYKPTLLANTDSMGNLLPLKSTIVAKHVISTTASDEIRSITANSLDLNNPAAARTGYQIGAKSGTAQVAGPDGSYLTNFYDGAYIGYVAGANTEYIILVRLINPKSEPGIFASGEAAKVWTLISNNLLNNFPIQPKNP